jgi:hypothetical protein
MIIYKKTPVKSETAEKFAFFMGFLKKMLKLFPEKSILYKTIALMSEYTGNLKTALKFYLIFIFLNTVDLELSVRYSILIFWNDGKYFPNYMLLKSIIKYNLFHVEIISFKAKILEQNKHFKQATQIWKNFLQRNLIFSNKKIQNENYGGLYLYCLLLWIRNIKKSFGSNFYNLELLKSIYFYYKRMKSNSKVSYIVIRLLICPILKINLSKNSSPNSISFFNLVSCNRQPYFVKIIKKISRIYPYNSNIVFFKNFLNIFSVHIKWYTLFGIRLNENRNFLSILPRKNCLYEYFFKSCESYNIFARIPKRKLILYSKLATLKKSSGFISQSLILYKKIVEKWSENLEPIIIIKKICKKLSNIKKSFKNFVKYLKKKIRKRLNFTKKKNARKINLKNLMDKAEEFLQEKKMTGLCRLTLLILSIDFQNSIFYSKYNQLSCAKLLEADLAKQKYKFLTKKNFDIQECLTKKIEKLGYKKSNFFFENLIEIVFTFIFKEKIALTNKKTNFFILNRLCFRKAGIKLKFILLSLAFKKKKYKKAYEYSRLICLENPNSLASWHILSKIEKQVGFAASKTLRFTLRLLKKYPNSIPGIIFAANHCSIFGSYAYSLAEYFQAYRWKKGSSFLNFSIYLQYLHKSLNRRNQNPEYTIILSLCFFFNYKTIRIFTSETCLKRSKKSISLKMEVLFNQAKLYLFLDLKYLALITFMRVINQENNILTLSKRNRRFVVKETDSLKNDSLLNIQLLYINSGNKILTSEIQQKIYF